MDNKMNSDDTQVIVKDDGASTLQGLRERAFYLCISIILDETNAKDDGIGGEEIQSEFKNIATDDKSMDKYITLERIRFILDNNLEKKTRGWVTSKGHFKAVITEIAREIHSGLLFDFSDAGFAEVAIDTDGEIAYQLDVPKAKDLLNRRK
jgi:hypothetical protein